MRGSLRALQAEGPDAVGRGLAAAVLRSGWRLRWALCRPARQPVQVRLPARRRRRHRSPTPTPSQAHRQLRHRLQRRARSMPISRPAERRSISGPVSWNGSATRRPARPQDVADQSRRWRRFGGAGGTALPGLGRGLWPQFTYRPAGRFRRRHQRRPGAGGRHRCAAEQGVNVGLSVDQSRTEIDVPLALQSATLDLTQFGFNASVDKGPWTWAMALVHGFGNINSRRDTGWVRRHAGYGAHVNGALTELDYYWTRDQSRIVPKVALEYVRASTGALQETGGLDPLSASGATRSARAFCSAPRSGTTGSSTARSSTSPPTANSSTIFRSSSALSSSASGPRASRCRASARAAMAPMPAPPPRSA